MKKLISLLLTLVLLLSFTACGKTEKLDVKCNVYGIAGPTGIGLANLMKTDADGEGNLDYNIALAASNDEIVAKISNTLSSILILQLYYN